MISQKEADELLAMRKMATDTKQYTYPSLGGHVEIPLVSQNRHEYFALTIRRGSIDIRKNTYQTRARRTIILARVDIAGPPHRNPDGNDIACPHIHMYREGYDDKWAQPLPDIFQNHADYWQVLQDFMLFCNIDSVDIKRDLFI
jgi:hypothetical protein